MSDRKLAFYDFSGGINTNSTKVILGNNSSKLCWDESFNVELYKNHGVHRMQGNKTFLQIEENSGIISMCEYPKSTQGFIFAQSDGKIKHYDNITKQIILVKDYGENIKRVIFIPYLDGIAIICDKFESFYYNVNLSENLQPLNAKTQSGEELYPQCGCIFAGRLWLSNNSTVYFSALGRFNDWESENDAGYIANFHSSTTNITAMQPYNGALAIYKTDGVYLLNGNSPSDFSIIKFADKGTQSANGVCTCNNKQYFFNADGLFSLSQVGELSQIMMSGDIANNIKQEFKDCDRTRIDKAFCVPYEKNNQIWFYIPKNGNEFFNNILIYDFLNKCWTKRVQPQEILCATNVNGEILSGCNNGKILLENTDSTFDGQKIDFKFSTPFLHLGKPSEKKIVENFSLLIEDNGENRFKFSTTKDFIKEKVNNIEYINVAQDGTLIWAKEEEITTDENCWNCEECNTAWTKIFECPIDIQIFDSNISLAIHIESEFEGDDFKLVGIEFKELLDDE